ATENYPSRSDPRTPNCGRGIASDHNFVETAISQGAAGVASTAPSPWRSLGHSRLANDDVEQSAPGLSNPACFYREWPASRLGVAFGAGRPGTFSSERNPTLALPRARKFSEPYHAGATDCDSGRARARSTQRDISLFPLARLAARRSRIDQGHF